MRALIPLGLLAIAIPAGAAAPPAKKGDTDLLARRVPGTPVRCIHTSQNQGPVIVDDKTILYNVSGGRIFRTGPAGACPSLRPLTTLVVEVRAGMLCQNNVFRVVQPGTSITSAYCRFQPFVPYDMPKG